MSTEATLPEIAATAPVVEAPVETAAPEAPARSMPKTAAEARAQLTQRLHGTPPPQVTPSDASPAVPPNAPVDANGRGHAPDGKYLPNSQTSPAAANADAGAEPAAAPQGTPPDAGAAEAAPDAGTPGAVSIPVPDFLQPRYGAEVSVPKAVEEIVRFAFNTPIRQREVEAIGQHAIGLEREVIRLSAELKAYQRQSDVLVSNPEIAAKVEQVRAAWGDADAEAYKVALLQKMRGDVDKDVAQTTQEYQAALVKDVADRFVGDALEFGRVRYPEWGPADVRQAVAAFGAWVEARGITEVAIDDFQKFADGEYVKHPKVSAQIDARIRANQDQERQRIAADARKAAEDEQRRKLEELATRRREVPLRGVPSTAGVPGAVAGGPQTAAEARDRIRLRRLGRA